MFVLIAYDISDDRRRRSIEKILSSYGKRVNYSVFEVEISKTNFKKLVEKLQNDSDSKEDHIRCYVLNKESLKSSFVLHRKSQVFGDEPLYF